MDRRASPAARCSAAPPPAPPSAAAPAFAQGAQLAAHNVRMIVPYPAGGSTDVLFRILAEKLKDKFGQSFVVENRPGASGNIGIDRSRKARRTATRSAARRSGISRSTSI